MTLLAILYAFSLAANPDNSNPSSGNSAGSFPEFRATPELRSWDEEDEQEEVEVWILPGTLPPAPIDGMPIIEWAQPRDRYET